LMPPLLGWYWSCRFRTQRRSRMHGPLTRTTEGLTGARLTGSAHLRLARADWPSKNWLSRRGSTGPRGRGTRRAGNWRARLLLLQSCQNIRTRRNNGPGGRLSH
jgi:hypothetical protein